MRIEELAHAIKEQHVLDQGVIAHLERPTSQALKLPGYRPPSISYLHASQCAAKAPSACSACGSIVRHAQDQRNHTLKQYEM